MPCAPFLTSSHGSEVSTVFCVCVVLCVVTNILEERIASIFKVHPDILISVRTSVSDYLPSWCRIYY